MPKYFVKVNHDGTVEKVEAKGNRLDQLQEMVGGLIEIAERRGGALVVVNEEGFILDPPLPMNRRFSGYAGNVVIALDGKHDIEPMGARQAGLMAHWIERDGILSEEEAESNRPTAEQLMPKFYVNGQEVK